jgi:nicotinamide riboside kinase
MAIRKPKIRRIVLTGPECTGKTTLLQQLADHYNAASAPEYARGYLTDLGRPYTEADFLPMVKGQLNIAKPGERAIRQEKTARMLICDTDFRTYRIWLEHKYHKKDDLVELFILMSKVDLYLLCYPDLKYVPDPLRENPNDLLELFDKYLQDLIAANKPYVIIKGRGAVRLKRAIAAIDRCYKGIK